MPAHRKRRELEPGAGALSVDFQVERYRQLMPPVTMSGVGHDVIEPGWGRLAHRQVLTLGHANPPAWQRPSAALLGATEGRIFEGHQQLRCAHCVNCAGKRKGC